MQFDTNFKGTLYCGSEFEGDLKVSNVSKLKDFVFKEIFHCGES